MKNLLIDDDDPEWLRVLRDDAAALGEVRAARADEVFKKMMAETSPPSEDCNKQICGEETMRDFTSTEWIVIGFVLGACFGAGIVALALR